MDFVSYLCQDKHSIEYSVGTTQESKFVAWQGRITIDSSAHSPLCVQHQNRNEHHSVDVQMQVSSLARLSVLCNMEGKAVHIN